MLLQVLSAITLSSVSSSRVQCLDFVVSHFPFVAPTCAGFMD